MDISNSGSLVALGDIDGCVKFFKSDDPKESQKIFSNHGRGVKSVKFSPDGNNIISGSEDLHINIFDVESQKRIYTVVNHADWITSICYNPVDPKYFVSTSLDKTIKIW